MHPVMSENQFHCTKLYIRYWHHSWMTHCSHPGWKIKQKNRKLFFSNQFSKRHCRKTQSLWQTAVIKQIFLHCHGKSNINTICIAEALSDAWCHGNSESPYLQVADVTLVKIFISNKLHIIFILRQGGGGGGGGQARMHKKNIRKGQNEAEQQDSDLTVHARDCNRNLIKRVATIHCYSTAICAIVRNVELERRLGQ